MRVIHRVGHVAEPAQTYPDYADPAFRDPVPRRLNVAEYRFVAANGRLSPDLIPYGPRPNLPKSSEDKVLGEEALRLYSRLP